MSVGLPRVTITNRISSLRQRHGLTQQDLAERTGVSRQTINAIEGGKYAPTLELAFRIARVFGEEIGAVFECRAAAR